MGAKTVDARRRLGHLRAASRRCETFLQMQLQYVQSLARFPFAMVKKLKGQIEVIRHYPGDAFLWYELRFLLKVEDDGQSLSIMPPPCKVMFLFKCTFCWNRVVLRALGCGFWIPFANSCRTCSRLTVLCTGSSKPHALVVVCLCATFWLPCFV